MAAHDNLQKAKATKNDEFYTQLNDIENELRHYREHFRGKVIYCNCDDPISSNFWRYFHLNYGFFGLKKLIATHYIAEGGAITMEYTGSNDTSIYEGKVTKLKGNGDFRDEECINILREADIVVTNPPFSLFREYLAQLIEFDKQFVIIAPLNALKYKEIFPLFMANKIWLGYGFKRNDAYFNIPQNSACNYSDKVYNAKTGQVHFRNCVWVTNLDNNKRHEPLDLIEKYCPEKYPKYDNYDAINVNRIFDIPCDYEGIMGVPITFMDKYCPEQFEIIGLDRYTIPKEKLVAGSSSLNGKPIYTRIYIKKR